MSFRFIAELLGHKNGYKRGRHPKKREIDIKKKKEMLVAALACFNSQRWKAFWEQEVAAASWLG